MPLIIMASLVGKKVCTLTATYIPMNKSEVKTSKNQPGYYAMESPYNVYVYLLVDWCILAGSANLLQHGARLQDKEYHNTITISDLGLPVHSEPAVSCQIVEFVFYCLDKGQWDPRSYGVYPIILILIIWQKMTSPTEHCHHVQVVSWLKPGL